MSIINETIPVEYELKQDQLIPEVQLLERPLNIINEIHQAAEAGFVPQVANAIKIAHLSDPSFKVEVQTIDPPKEEERANPTAAIIAGLCGIDRTCADKCCDLGRIEQVRIRVDLVNQLKQTDPDFFDNPDADQILKDRVSAIIAEKESAQERNKTESSQPELKKPQPSIPDAWTKTYSKEELEQRKRDLEGTYVQGEKVKLVQTHRSEPKTNTQQTKKSSIEQHSTQTLTTTPRSEIGQISKPSNATSSSKDSIKISLPADQLTVQPERWIPPHMQQMMREKAQPQKNVQPELVLNDDEKPKTHFPPTDEVEDIERSFQLGTDPKEIKPQQVPEVTLGVEPTATIESDLKLTSIKPTTQKDIPSQIDDTEPPLIEQPETKISQERIDRHYMRSDAESTKIQTTVLSPQRDEPSEKKIEADRNITQRQPDGIIQPDHDTVIEANVLPPQNDIENTSIYNKNKIGKTEFAQNTSVRPPQEISVSHQGDDFFQPMDKRIGTETTIQALQQTFSMQQALQDKQTQQASIKTKIKPFSSGTSNDSLPQYTDNPPYQNIQLIQQTEQIMMTDASVEYTADLIDVLTETTDKIPTVEQVDLKDELVNQNETVEPPTAHKNVRALPKKTEIKEETDQFSKDSTKTLFSFIEIIDKGQDTDGMELAAIVDMPEKRRIEQNEISSIIQNPDDEKSSNEYGETTELPIEFSEVNVEGMTLVKNEDFGKTQALYEALQQNIEVTPQEITDGIREEITEIMIEPFDINQQEAESQSDMSPEERIIESVPMNKLAYPDELIDRESLPIFEPIVENSFTQYLIELLPDKNDAFVFDEKQENEVPESDTMFGKLAQNDQKLSQAIESDESTTIDIEKFKNNTEVTNKLDMITVEAYTTNLQTIISEIIKEKKEAPVMILTVTEEKSIEQDNETKLCTFYLLDHEEIFGFMMIIQNIIDILFFLQKYKTDNSSLPDINFSINLEAASEELKNNTFGKYDDTVVMILFQIIQFMLFIQNLQIFIPQRTTNENQLTTVAA